MAGSTSEDSGVGRSSDGISSQQRCQSGEALAEWRSCEQVENGTPSTSPLYWDTDDDDDCGAKPSELFGKFTWKIENFSQISKRELRSNAFEVGGYKWYILIYPQGCDVCNHLSLFLCVANHDKLLPGWSHFAQFTIAVVNKDPKKSKYSGRLGKSRFRCCNGASVFNAFSSNAVSGSFADTLHRFWKKEHDWGWKKFMELSKVLDGFIVADTLVIKAQVQVIREKADRPFRCLDCQYRRELVRVYLTNVEQICRRFVEERRGKLAKLIEDKVRWLSFCTFWLGVDKNIRRRMSREKTDVILKVVVKHFFIEKEVTSTLVMDSLYSGLKALEFQSESKKGQAKLCDVEETSAPIVCVEKDMFVLEDDVLQLLERAALEPLPPKDEKGPQNRTKDGSSGEDFNKDSIERDERRLTELGRRTVEIFVLAHIFSNRIEVAYQEAVALKRQEELIREEEAAGQAESEQKTKRGATEKEKRSKKKQAKQRRSSQKGKDRGRDDKSDVAVQDKYQRERPNDERTVDDFSVKQAQSVLDKPDAVEDVSGVSDAGDDVTELLQPHLEDRVGSPVNWDTDTSSVHPAIEASSCGMSGLPLSNGRAEKKSPSVIDDSSSTCSTDSVPSVVMNGPYKGNSLQNYKRQTSPNRGKIQRGMQTCERINWAHETDTPEVHPATEASSCGMSGLPFSNGRAEKKSPSIIDDSSSTCSTDSVTSVDPLYLFEFALQFCRGKIQRGMQTCERTNWAHETDNRPADLVMDAGCLSYGSGSCRAAEPESESVLSLKDRIQWLEQHLVEKVWERSFYTLFLILLAAVPSLRLQEEEVISLQKKLIVNDQVDVDRPSKHRTTAGASSSPSSPTRSPPLNVKPKSLSEITAPAEPVLVWETSLNNPRETDKAIPLKTPSTQITAMSKPDAQKTATPKPSFTQIEKPTVHQVPVMSRPLSAPLIPGPRPTAPVVSMVQTAPLLERSVSAAGRLATDTSSATHSYLPQSYRNFIMGKTVAPRHSSNPAVNPLNAYSQPPSALVSQPKLSPQRSERKDRGLVRPGFTFGTVTPEILQKQPQQDSSVMVCDPSLLNDDLYDSGSSGPRPYSVNKFPASVSARQAQAASAADEFPHLDIINYLFDEEHSIGRATKASVAFQSPSNGHHHHLNRQFTFPGDIGMSADTIPAINRCRFERPASYFDGVRRVYRSSSGHLNGQGDVVPQVGLSAYGVGQVDGVIQDQWPVSGADPSMLTMRNTEGNGYPFHVQEYSNMACGVNRYTVFQPSNGH
ncbi:hypothetical protein HHK36_026862 [Tetracentron sinense]|uniref:MATH domain-containing protein n=1 Tax=Tetracentron sinense TaxID=13715 RepID=A0A834YJG8_TETSI|nr:hypothetical protein HHK36_026862 [Tetracentron sinense]